VKEGSLLVLTATVSRGDRRALELVLKEAGFEVRGVDGAGDADTELSSHSGRCVLVIDSGLLNMAHDAQWRFLRERHPELCAVVRCLIPEGQGIQAAERRTLLVHPDHGEDLLEAVRRLAATAIGT
jgi:hypothetical protein